MATIKCPNCGVYNTNRDYCEECKTVLSYKIRRELAFKKQEEERLKQAKSIEKEPSFFEKYVNHRYFLVRISAKIIRSIWLVFMAIGMFIAWLISAIVA
ncbi:TFIIB-type zinc ribbon-containing protein [Xanthomarina spongicola]|uniref:TFIIB-type zinc ribbon-containing protein n=1 Tax=Xanthomarina spongicola TaxID=570520 RepID=A0A316DS36_9FLAO|nr:hypothetical protein [Xanthomarina spongicola]PWK20775.1 hypothetical protein LX78_00478 [Xanthomarina spongicola]